MTSVFELHETKKCKTLLTPVYNYIFSKETGYFARWGATPHQDVPFSPFGPEILDIEISQGGQCQGKCQFCYKGNGQKTPTKNMPLDTFKQVFEKIRNHGFLTQIAFGIMDVSTNPDFFDIMKYTRNGGVIPNYTTHGLDMTDEFAALTSEFCGGCAVSIVQQKKTFRAINILLDHGVKQVNIHFVLAQENIEQAMRLIKTIGRGQKLKQIKSIVFLQYKPKIPNPNFHSVDDPNVYREIVDRCIEYNVGMGFDSCSFPMFAKAIEPLPQYDKWIMFSEPCESTLFSGYINCEAKFFPCSFAEGVGEWKEGLDVLKADNFVQDIWMHERTQKFRQNLLDSTECCPDKCKSKKSCKCCPVYELAGCRSFALEETIKI